MIRRRNVASVPEGAQARERDFELVRRIARGERAEAAAAFEALHRQYRGRIFHTALRILRDTSAAEDATQETFLALLRKAAQFDFRSAFSSWLHRVAVNLSIDLRRRMLRRSARSLCEAEILERIGDRDRRRPIPATAEPMERIERSELTAAVDRALTDLSPLLAEVIVLRYREGREYRDMAERLAVPVGTVKSRLNRAHSCLVGRLAAVAAPA